MTDLEVAIEWSKVGKSIAAWSRRLEPMVLELHGVKATKKPGARTQTNEGAGSKLSTQSLSKSELQR